MEEERATTTPSPTRVESKLSCRVDPTFAGGEPFACMGAFCMFSKLGELRCFLSACRKPN